GRPPACLGGGCRSRLPPGVGELVHSPSLTDRCGPRQARGVPRRAGLARVGSVAARPTRRRPMSARAGSEAPDRNLALELVRVTEAAAMAAARKMGYGDKEAVDQAAVDAMRAVLGSVSMTGTVVIGEGEKDNA